MGRKYLWSLFIIAVTGILILLVITYDYSPSGRHSFITSSPRERNRSKVWHNRKGIAQLKGVALVTHGLNLRPERMGDIIRALNEAGIDVLNLSLFGHGNNFMKISGLTEEEARLESFRLTSYPLWTSEVHEAYLNVRKRAASKKVPVYFVGYSLGGLIGCNLLSSAKNVFFNRMILFAPSFRVPAGAHLLKPLTPFPHLVIDSLSPPSYRSNDGTPMAAYNALFEAIEHFEGGSMERLNIPTLVFIDEKDEFVPYEKINELAEQKFSRWEVVPITKDEADSKAKALSHHLIIDEASMGKESWKQMKLKMIRHFNFTRSEHP